MWFLVDEALLGLLSTRQTEGRMLLEMICLGLAGREQHDKLPQVWTVPVNGLAKGRSLYLCIHHQWLNMHDSCHLVVREWTVHTRWLGNLPVNEWTLLKRWMLSRSCCSLLGDLNLERKSVTKSLFVDVVTGHPEVWQEKETLLFTGISHGSFRKSLFTPGTSKLTKAIFWAKLLTAIVWLSSDCERQQYYLEWIYL